MTLLLVILIGGWLLYRLQTTGISKAMVLFGWAIKLVAAYTFVIIYTYYYGVGNLSADPGVFLYESTLLTSVASHSWADFFQFMFGLETEALVHHYLTDTLHWSSGDLSIINDNRNVIRLNSLLNFISNGNIWIHVTIFSWFSLLGFRELYLTLIAKSNLLPKYIWLILMAIPSIAIWTGSNLKEPLMIAGFCLVFRAFFDKHLSKQGFWWRLLLGIGFMMAFKPYVFVAVCLMLLAYLLGRKLPNKFQFFSPLIILFLIIIGMSSFHKFNDKAIHFLTRKQFDFINVGRGGLHAYADTCFFYFEPKQYHALAFEKRDFVELKKPIWAKKVKLGQAHPFEDVYLKPTNTQWSIYYESPYCPSYIEITRIDNSYWNLIYMIPEALINTLFRPTLGDPGGPMKYVAMLEMVTLLLFFLFQLRNWKTTGSDSKLLIISLLFFVFIMSLIIGWITPVLGAIVRYRIPIYLAIAICSILLYNSPQKQLKNKQQ